MKNMKRFISILIPAILSGGLSGCYEDKGNYDYNDINEVSFTLTATDQNGRNLPINEDGFCRYKQPSSGDTMYVTYTPHVTQSLRGEDTTNLEWQWIVAYNKNKKAVTDSINSKELTLKFPPAQASAYNVIFSVTDLSTNVSHYKSLSIKVVQPYRNSWFVLNGQEGDRYISTVEDPDSTNYLLTKDAYADLGNERRFQDATDLVYAPSLWEYKATLQILSKDSIWMMKPTELKVLRSNKQMLKFDASSNGLLYGVNGNSNTRNTLLATSNGRVYQCDTYGEYQEIINKEIPYYKATVVGEFNENNNILVWEDTKKILMIANTYTSDFTHCPDEKTFSKKTPIWIGASTSPEKNAVGMVLMKDENGIHYIYDLVAQDKHEEYMLSDLDINETSLFASNPALTNLGGQMFYTKDSKLYRLNIKGGESFELYDAGGTISIMKFRVNHTHSRSEEDPQYHLGLVVNQGGKGELHDVTLTNGGDVETSKTKIYEGFGEIVDICFSFMEITD